MKPMTKQHIKLGSCAVALVLALSALGCGDRKDGVKSDGDAGMTATEAFSKMAERAMAEDHAYLKEHMTPATLAAAKAAAGGDEAKGVRDLAMQLQRSTANACESKPGDGKHMVVKAAADRLLPEGVLGEYRVDMMQDAKYGWLLASLPYDKRPISK